MSQPSVVVKVSGIVSLVIGLLLALAWAALLTAQAPVETPIHDDFFALRWFSEAIGLALLAPAMLVTGWALIQAKPWARTLANITAGLLAALTPLYVFLTIETNHILSSALANSPTRLSLATGLVDATRQTVIAAAIIALYAVGLLVMINRRPVRKHFQARFYGLV